MKIKTVVAFASVLALVGCAQSFDISQEAQNAPLRPEAKDALQTLRGNTYVREIKPVDLVKQRPLTLIKKSAALRTVLMEALPGYAIIPEGAVSLSQSVDISADGMTVADFLEYLEGTLDVHITIDGRRVVVSSFQTKEWNLAAFASTRNVKSVIASVQTRGAKAGDDDEIQEKGGSNQTTGNTIGYTLSEDEWVKIMDGAKRILGVRDDKRKTLQNQIARNSAPVVQMPANGMEGLDFDGYNSGSYPAPMEVRHADEPYIEGIRSVGIVTAGGSPAKVKLLDRYFKRAISESTKVVNVQVQSYDVILNNSKQKGIDWNILAQGTLNGNPLGLSLFNTVAGGSASDPFWNVSGTYESSNVKADMLIRFLETYGRVELQDQPNLTVRNGVPAQIYAGEELTYIVDVEQTQDVNGNVTVTPKLGRLKVGVTLSVTVRVLDNDQLLVDVMPVISNLNAPDTIVIGDYNFQTPRIALKEFSTQLITTSGRSVHLGGLITKRLGKAMEHLPWQNLVTKAVLNPFTQNINNSLERRELVLVVTPTLVEGAM